MALLHWIHHYLPRARDLWIPASIDKAKKEFNKKREECRNFKGMELPQRFLQYGAQVTFPAHTLIYRGADPVGARPVFYVVAGLIKVEYPLRTETFSLWLHPDSIFGLVEPLAECARLCTVQAMERTLCYAWDREGFFTAAGVSWELALAAITGMSRELRTLNAEFGERLRALQREP
jgi:CRP-like cAMP-binding protein